MSLNTDHIRVTHAGSLPRTPELIAANAAKETDGVTPEFLELLESSVVEVVQRQKDLGIDIPNDGEYGHTMSSSVDYGAWWNYSFARLGGLEPTNVDRWADAQVHRSSPGNIVLTSFPDRRDRQAFNEAYNDPSSGILSHRKSVTQPKITGPPDLHGPGPGGLGHQEPEEGPRRRRPLGRLRRIPLPRLMRPRGQRVLHVG